MKPQEYAAELVRSFKPMVRAKMSEDEGSVHARAVNCALHHINILLTLDIPTMSEGDEQDFYDWYKLVKLELQKL
jgi:hypothetical protein